MAYEERGAYGGEPIKSEPRDKTPPHQSSPRSVFSPSYEQEHVPDSYQQWQMPAINIPGPSHMGYNPDMQWGQNYTNLPQLSPNMQQSNLPSMASNMQPMTSYMQQNTLQPIQSMSPNMQAMSPNMQMSQMSPMGQVMSPVGGISPMTHGGMSPNMGHVSPNMGHVSPAMGHISPNLMQQQLPQQDMMETAAASDTPSLTGLLMERGEGIQYTSGEFPSLSSLLDTRGPDLSDSLNKLSTSDLLH